MILTVRRFESGLGIEFPQAMVERLGLKEGDELSVVEQTNGILLTGDSTFARVMEAYEVGSRKYENALRALADS